MFLHQIFDFHKNQIYKKFNNDSVDRFHQVLAPSILIAFVVALFIRQTYSSSIICFENAYEIKKWNAFINNWCFIEPTYFVPPGQVNFPVDDATRNLITIEYYPLIPVLLFFLAVLCYFPHWIWETFHYRSGIDIRSLVASLAVNDLRAQKILKPKSTCNSRNKTIVAKEFLAIFKSNSDRKDRICGIIPHRLFLTTLYITYKLLNLANISLQIWFLNYYLNTKYTFWGAEILWDIWHHIGWKTSARFPRVIYCDFPRRDDATGKTFMATSQCLLPLNLFNEAIFIFIWFFYGFLLITNLISILGLLIFIFNSKSNEGFVENMIADLKKHHIDRKHPEFSHFIHEVLGKDGLVTLWLLSANSVTFSISQFVGEVFKHKNLYFAAPKNYV